jgi:Tol biopolymer transport system component
MMIAFSTSACNAKEQIASLSNNPSNSDLPAATKPIKDLSQSSCPENLGKIVFSYDPLDIDSSHFGIYLMNADGSERRLVSSPEEIHAMAPAWAPDRCRIAYQSFTKEGNDDIYMITADGKTVQQLTNDPAWDVFPDWSPDGKQISFISNRGGIRNLFVMDADGKNVRQVTKYEKNGIDWTDWSPLGDEIAFSYHSDPDDGIGPRIFAIHPDGSGLRQMVPSDGDNSAVEPAWSPDGKKIYFVSNKTGEIEIWEINSDGSGLRQISHWNYEIKYTHSLHVSPDGTQLAFYGVPLDADLVKQFNQAIFVVNVDGSGLTDITLSPGQEEWLDW